jgi:hypothetical protein
MTLSDGDIRSEGKLQGQIYRRCIYTRLQERKYYMNIGPLKHVRLTNSWKLKNIQRVRLVVPYRCWRRQTSFCHSRVGTYTMISYETSVHSSCKMWIYRLGFIYESCMLVLRHIFFLHFWNLEQSVSGTMDRARWTKNMRCLFPDVNPLDFSLWIYQNFVCYATEISEVQIF